MEKNLFLIQQQNGDFGVERKEREAAEPREFPNDMIFEQDPTHIVQDI
jgi:F-type H+-transporting ATPase subunit gamma